MKNLPAIAPDIELDLRVANQIAECMVINQFTLTQALNSNTMFPNILSFRRIMLSNNEVKSVIDEANWCLSQIYEGQLNELTRETKIPDDVDPRMLSFRVKYLEKRTDRNIRHDEYRDQFDYKKSQTSNEPKIIEVFDFNSIGKKMNG